MRAKQIDVLLRPTISVVAVDPEKSDWAGPTTCEVTGVLAMGFDRALDAARSQRRTKVIPRRPARADIRIGDRRSGVRIDGDHRAEAVPHRDGRQPDGRLPFKTADFEDDALGWSGCRDEGEKAGLALGEKPGRGAHARPRLVDRRDQIGRSAQQYCSKAEVRSAAMSRALRPSMLRRSSMNTSCPSLNSAICGEDGA